MLSKLVLILLSLVSVCHAYAISPTTEQSKLCDGVISASSVFNKLCNSALDKLNDLYNPSAPAVDILPTELQTICHREHPCTMFTQQNFSDICPENKNLVFEVSYLVTVRFMMCNKRAKNYIYLEARKDSQTKAAQALANSEPDVTIARWACKTLHRQCP